MRTHGQIHICKICTRMQIWSCVQTLSVFRPFCFEGLGMGFDCIIYCQYIYFLSLLFIIYSITFANRLANVRRIWNRKECHESTPQHVRHGYASYALHTPCIRNRYVIETSHMCRVHRRPHNVHKIRHSSL